VLVPGRIVQLLVVTLFAEKEKTANSALVRPLHFEGIGR